MLKSSKIRYNWIFQVIIIGYFYFLRLETTVNWFFHRVELYNCAIAGHELGTLSTPVHNTLSVHDNSWALKFDNFSEY